MEIIFRGTLRFYTKFIIMTSKRSNPLYMGPDVEDNITCRIIEGYAYRNVQRENHIETYCIGRSSELFSVKCYGTKTSFILYPFKPKCNAGSSQEDIKKNLLEGKMESINDVYDSEFFDNAIEVLIEIFEKILSRLSMNHSRRRRRGGDAENVMLLSGGGNEEDTFKSCKEHQDFVKKKLTTGPRFEIRKIKCRWFEQGWTLPNVTFLKCSFRSNEDRCAIMKCLKYELPLPINATIPAFSLHEQRTDPIMAHMVRHGLTVQGWICFKDAREKAVAIKNSNSSSLKKKKKKKENKKKKKKDNNNKGATGDHGCNEDEDEDEDEDKDGRGAPFKTFVTDKVRQLTGPQYDTTIPKPKILSFDIETYTDRNSPMNAKDPKNPIFNISIVIWEPYHRCVSTDCDCGGIVTNDPEPGDMDFPNGLDNCRTTCILLTTKRVDADVIQKNRPGRPVYVEECLGDEKTMILRFLQVIKIAKPTVITGYNIIHFDFEYLEERMKVLNMGAQLERLGVVKYTSESAAMKTNNFCWFDYDSAVILDPFKIIQIMDTNLTSYSLNSVANKYLGETKDPVDHDMITRSYEANDETPEGLDLCTTVGTYCIKDSELVIRLINHLNLWVHSIELAKSGKVEITDTFTRGKGNQMYKLIYSTIKKKETPLRCIVENIKNDAFLYNVQMKKRFPDEFRWVGQREYESYLGAAIVNPIPQLSFNTMSFDYAAMYPSIMQDYNMCLSTEVTDDRVVANDKGLILSDKQHIDDMEDFDGIVARKKAGIYWKKALQRFYVTEHKACEHDPKKIECDNIGRQIEEETKLLKEKRGVDSISCGNDDLDDAKLLQKGVEQNIKILQNVAKRTSIISKNLFRGSKKHWDDLRILETLQNIKLLRKKTPATTVKGKSTVVERAEVKVERVVAKLKTQRRIMRRRVAESRLKAEIGELRRKRKELKISLTADKVICKEKEYFFITERAKLEQGSESLVTMMPQEKSNPELYDAETDEFDVLALSSVTDEDAGESVNDRRIRRVTSNKRKISKKRNWYRDLIGRGVIPIIQIQLLQGRKDTRNEMKHHNPSSLDFKVLNARQNSIKINMNSIYGCLGASTSPFNSKTIARCVTHMGRRSNGWAAKILQSQFGAQLIYGDTDSCYVTIPRIDSWSVEDKWKECLRISKEIHLDLPNELILEFEDSLYTKFLIFGKKRYCHLSISDPQKPDEIKFSSKGTILDKKNQAKFSKESFDLVIKTIVFKNRPEEKEEEGEGEGGEGEGEGGEGGEGVGVVRLSRTAMIKADIISFLIDRMVLLQIYTNTLWNRVDNEDKGDNNDEEEGEKKDDENKRTSRHLLEYFTISSSHRVVGSGIITTKNPPCSSNNGENDDDNDGGGSSASNDEQEGGETTKGGIRYYGSYKVKLFNNSDREKVLAEFDGSEEMYLRDKLTGPAMLVARMRSRGEDFAGRVNHVVLEDPVITFAADPTNKLPKMKKQGYKIEEKEHYLHYKRNYSKIDADYYFRSMSKSFEKLLNACCCLFQNEEKSKIPGNTRLNEYGDTIYKGLTLSMNRKRACMKELLSVVKLAK